MRLAFGLVLIAGVFLFSVFLTPPVFAQEPAWGDCVVNDVAQLTCIPVIFQRVINFALVFAGVAALIFVIFSGIRFISSGGNPEQVKGARNTLIYAIIGFVLILLSFFIVNVISEIAGVSCIREFGFGNC